MLLIILLHYNLVLFLLVPKKPIRKQKKLLKWRVIQKR
jgi:hypothetical protein